MNRLDKFRNLNSHALYGKSFSRLPKKWIDICENFIIENKDLDKNEFAHKINRWLMDRGLSEMKKSEKSKWLTCQELIASINV